MRQQLQFVQVCDEPHFSIIQAAIDAANPGDVVKVHSGTYYENVNVSKQLTLQGMETCGSKPIVDAGESGSAITLTVDGITIEGFVARNSSPLETGGSQELHGGGAAGIKVSNELVRCPSNISIIDNILENNGRGIYVVAWGDSYNKIRGNIVRNNNIGVHISGDKNEISKNIISSNGGGIHLCGNYNNVINNEINHNGNGISTFYGSRNNIKDNIIDSNGCAFWFEYANGNIITGNVISNSGSFLDGEYVDNNVFYYNNFIGNNEVSLAHDQNNQFDSGVIGNHYSNYDEHSEGCYDKNADGICDKSLILKTDGGHGVLIEDRYPLVTWPLKKKEIPEFPTMAIPVISIIGLMFLFQRRKGK